MTEFAPITSITDHGSIVAVYLHGQGPVFFDHRPFGWLLQARGGDVDALIGQRARLGEYEDWNEPVLEFEEEVE